MAVHERFDVNPVTARRHLGSVAQQVQAELAQARFVCFEQWQHAGVLDVDVYPDQVHVLVRLRRNRLPDVRSE